VQFEEPGLEAKDPDEHAVQDDCFGALLAKPAVQLSHRAWPVALCAEPAGQIEQLEAPALEAKDPDEHNWHTIVASVGVKSPTGHALQLVAPAST